MNDKLLILPTMRDDAVVPGPIGKAAPKAASQYVTGHCSVGNCYKTNNLSNDGKRMLPSCQWKYEYRDKLIVCTHSCHTEYAEMIELIRGMQSDDGTPLPLPDRLREAANYVARIDDRPGRLAAPIVPIPAGPREFTPTPSGRAAKGELEENVRKAIISVLGFPEITPNTLAFLIDPEDPPSVGAIHAVFRRWESKGLCTVHDKPFRFGEFTELGNQILRIKE